MKPPTFSIRELAPCFFAIFIDILGFGLVYPVLTALFTSIDTSILPEDASQSLRFFYLSLGFLLYPLFMFFGASFMGDLSDILGRKKVLMICMGGLLVGFSFMGVGVKVSNIALLLIGRAVTGLMGASMPVALAAIADLSTPKNKAVHMSFVSLVQSIGFVLGPFMGGVLSDSSLVHFFDFSIPFFISGGLALIAIFWLWAAFDETFIRQVGPHIDLRRFFRVFVDASKHRAVRLLSLVFLLMQMGIALYLQLILIFYKNKFNYSSLKMGMFNAFLGLWFAIGLIVVVPYLVKRCRVEWIAFFCLLVSGLAEILVAITGNEWFLWMIGIPLAIAVQVGFTSMLTAFSNAVDAKSQGWAMGITGSVIAISFALTGLSPNLVPLTGVKLLIFLGGLLMLMGCLVMFAYCKRILPTQPTH